MSVEKMREEFEAWAMADAETTDKILKFERCDEWYLGRDRQVMNLGWAAWKGSHEALLRKQAQEQEEFLAHLAGFEQEDTFHD